MKKDEKKGFFGKLFGKKNSEGCCTMELEEMKDSEELKGEATSKKEEQKQRKGGGCCCGC